MEVCSFHFIFSLALAVISDFDLSHSKWWKIVSQTHFDLHFPVGCLFVLLSMSFVVQKFLSFRRCHLFVVGLSVCATGVIFRYWYLVPMHLRSLPTFSSIRSSVAGLY